VERRPLSLRIDPAQKLLHHGVMDVFTRRITGFGFAPGGSRRSVICRMFNRAIAKQTAPKHHSSDNDPLFRFHRWRANLRLLEVDEIKTIPCTALAHPFVDSRRSWARLASPVLQLRSDRRNHFGRTRRPVLGSRTSTFAWADGASSGCVFGPGRNTPSPISHVKKLPRFATQPRNCERLST
jgi:hypothetical protein